jgi:adenine-specific DNA-methyltransferase
MRRFQTFPPSPRNPEARSRATIGREEDIGSAPLVSSGARHRSPCYKTPVRDEIKRAGLGGSHAASVGHSLNPMLIARPAQLLHRSSQHERDLTQPVYNAIRALPSTRFYGSKRKLLPWIYSNIASLQFETALDLFGGSGSVSLLFKIMRKSVVYHDGLRFNEDVGRTLLANEISMPRSTLLAFLDGVIPRVGVISKVFDGIFYTSEENRWLDGFVAQLNSEQLSTEQMSLLRYLLYQACLRKRPFNLFHRANLHLRTNSRVNRSFGNFVTWERSFYDHISQAYDELPHGGPIHQVECTVLSSQNAEDIPAGYDLVYIDPPYINVAQRHNWDNYWRRYHFLEGLARYEEWRQFIDLDSNIRLLAPPKWVAAWSRRHTFTERLFSLIQKHSRSIVVLSYVSDAYPCYDEIKAFFESSFVNVKVHTKIHNHALSRSIKREFLFVGWQQ